MKPMYAVRPIDSNGRIVIPRNMLTDVLKVKEDDDKPLVEITCNGDSVIINRFHQPCDFCGETENLLEFKNGKICPNCLKEIKNLK